MKKCNNIARVIFARAKKFDSKFRLVEPAGSAACFCGQCVMDWGGKAEEEEMPIMGAVTSSWIHLPFHVEMTGVSTRMQTCPREHGHGP